MLPCHAASGRRAWEGEHPPKRLELTADFEFTVASRTESPECPLKRGALL
jgi:hypothetical protein